MALLLALLASPIAWIHYTLFLMPLLMSRWRLPAMRIVALLLIVPVPFILDRFGQPALVQATVGSVYNWALVLCLAAVLMPWERGRRAVPASAAA